MTTEHEHEELSQLAYRLWHERGCPIDSPEVDWLEAERQLSSKVDQSVEQSFPASDPPATHFPDRPPSNADDKWKASKETPLKTPLKGPSSGRH